LSRKRRSAGRRRGGKRGLERIADDRIDHARLAGASQILLAGPADHIRVEFFGTQIALKL
jgi:hypothetical protein